MFELLLSISVVRYRYVYLLVHCVLIVVVKAVSWHLEDKAKLTEI